MKKTKQVLLLLLMACFVFSLAACSGGNNEGNNKEANNKAANTPANDGATNTPAVDEGDDGSANTPAEEAFDLGGRTITIAAWWDGTPAGNTESEKQILQNIADLEKKHNFKLKYENVAYDQIVEKTTSSVLAGAPFADIVRLERNMAFPGLITKDIVQPIDGLLDQSGIDRSKFVGELFNKVAQFNGKLYGWGDNPYFDYSGIVYNRTLLQKLGLKDLVEYVNEGTWTWDTFKDVAAKATQGDSFGFVDFTSDFLDFALASNNADLIDVTNKKQTLDDPKTLEAMQFTQDVMNANYFPEGDRNDWQYPGAAFRKGNVLMYAAFNWMTQSIKQDMGDAVDLGFVPFPQGPSADNFYTNATAPNFWTIPKGVKDADKVLYLVNKIYDVPPSDEYPGQTTLEATYTNENDIQMARKAAENLKFMDYKLLMSIYSNDFYPMMDDLTKGKKSPASAVEARKSIFQKAIDDSITEGVASIK